MHEWDRLHDELDSLSNEMNELMLIDINNKNWMFPSLDSERFKEIRQRKIDIVKILHKLKKVKT